MKNALSSLLYILFAIWLLMAVIKIIMAFGGATDPINGRGSGDFFVSGVLQLLLAGAAFYCAKKLRAAARISSYTKSELLENSSPSEIRSERSDS